MLSYTLFIVLVTIYYHHIAVLYFSYDVIYHIHLICVYLSFSIMFYVCINLRSGYEKELYAPEGIITVRESDLYLCDPNGALIYVNSMLQQLYPYRHAYLFNYLVISKQ